VFADLIEIASLFHEATFHVIAEIVAIIEIVLVSHAFTVIHPL